MASVRSTPHRRALRVLTLLFGLEWLLLAIDPNYRGDWLLENVLPLVFIGLLWLTARRLPLSRVSYVLIFIFLFIHETGAHYTYAEVPYDAWFRALTGTGFNELVGWERNNFDRIVHFLYGLLLFYPIREVYFRVAGAGGFWSYFLPLDFAMSTSMIYELVEWGAAELFGGDLGMAYLGTQGDVWDAHKDMLLASGGAFIAMLVVLAINLYLQKDFAREWSASLSVKHARPMGEDEIARLWRRKRETDHK
jgi:putative membrane protein